MTEFKVGDKVVWLCEGDYITATIVEILGNGRICCNNWSDDPANPSGIDHYTAKKFRLLTPLEELL